MGAPMKTISPAERKVLIDDIVLRHVRGEESLGIAIRRLRLEVTGLDQDSFAAMCKMSTKALYQVEKDKGNPTIKTIDGILRKFGLCLSLALAATPTGLSSFGQTKSESKTRARGANPQRKSTGRRGGSTSLQAPAKAENKDSDRGQTNK